MIADEVQSPLAAAALPQALKEAGWKLERRVKNGDEEHPQFQVRNEKLKIATDWHNTLEDAIEGALVLQTRSEGKKVSRVKIKEQVKALGQPANSKQQTAEISDQKFEISEVARAKIRVDGGTQPRGELKQETVDVYAEAMLARCTQNEPYDFPPITVFHDGKHYWLADGFHRFFAHKKTFPTESQIGVELRQGTKRDAVLYSLGANAEHGLPRSNADKRRAVMTLLEDKEWRERADGWVAETAKVSATYVGTLRKEVERTLNVSSSTVRRGKDNRVRETKNIGAKKKAETEAIKTESVGDFTFTDKRRLGEDEVRDSKRQLIADKMSALSAKAAELPGKAASISELLKGRMLTISFAWIPQVPGVNVTVNASNDREKATRKLIGSVEVPAMPEVVIEMIAVALGEKTSPKSKVQSPKSGKKSRSPRVSKGSKKSAKKR